MSKTKKQTSTFELEGRFLTFLVEKSYEIKALQLATAEGAYTIRLSREARASVGRVLTPGDWIQVSGTQKIDLATGNTKLKAQTICPVAPSRAQPLPPAAAKTVPSTTKILVCQKSSCRKRGANGVCQALEATLQDRGLRDQVTIQPTGCMDRCKSGPHIVVMPDKARYSRVSPEEIPDLIDKHLGKPMKPVASPEFTQDSAQIQEIRTQ